MYKIQWQSYRQKPIVGLSVYPTKEAAWRQVLLFSRVAPQNNYSISVNTPRPGG